MFDTKFKCLICICLHSLLEFLDLFCFLTNKWDMLSKMQLQLQSLMETLSTTEPHYIRCVKPNNVLKPAIFENLNVIQQLRCGVSIISLYRLLCFCTSSILWNLQSLTFLFYNPVCLANSCVFIICCRVFLRQSESAVLDILLDEHFMSFFTALVFLLLRFWKESKCRFLFQDFMAPLPSYLIPI